MLKIRKPRALYEFMNKIFFQRIKEISEHNIFLDSPKLFYTIRQIFLY